MDYNDWARAGSIEDLTALTIEWLEGVRGGHPMQGDGEPADAETAEISDDLIFLNQSGFLTTFSQPGMTIEDGSGQRAAVGGVCSKELAWTIAAVGLETDLLPFPYPPEWAGGYMVPITTFEFHPCTWCGGAYDEEWIKSNFGDGCSPEGIAAIRSSWSVAVIDPIWGRKRHLWNELRRVISTETRWNIETPGRGLVF